VRTATTLAALAVAAVLTQGAAASFTTSITPSYRYNDSTTHHHWDVFSQEAGAPNYADIESSATGMSNPNPFLANYSEGAILTGAGNIYGFGAALSLAVHGSGDAQQVDFQFATEGTPMLNFTAALSYVTTGGVGGTLSHDYEDNYHYVPGDFGGNPGVYAHTHLGWDLSSITETVDSWTITIQAAGPHASLTAAMLDVNYAVIPGPSALAVLGLGALIGPTRRRRA